MAAQEIQARYAQLWTVMRGTPDWQRGPALLVLADFCESVGDINMGATARGWAKNPRAYIPHTPRALTLP